MADNPNDDDHRPLSLLDAPTSTEGVSLEPLAVNKGFNSEENRKLVLKDGDFCLFKLRSFEMAEIADVMKIQENLNVLMSSLPSNEEIKLFQIFLALKVKYWSLKVGCGIVTSFDTGYVDDKGQVYTCLMHLEDGKNTRLLICWLLKRQEGLDLFIPELDEYVSRIKQQLQSLSIASSSGDITFDHDLLTLLQSWTEESIMYLRNIVFKYQDYLPVLLHSALVNKVKFSGTDQKTISELKLFIKACSVDVLTSNAGSELLDIEDDNTVIVTIISPTELQISPSVKSEFSTLWAKKLVAKGQEASDPFYLKTVISRFKLKIIQDVNAVKRLVRDAEVNYYALYKCYTLLKSTGNIDLLLKGLISDANHLKETETLAVLYAIKDYHCRQLTTHKEKTRTEKSTDKPLILF